jgi:ribokinase
VDARGRVIVVGSVNIDLVVAASRLPSPGETVTGGTFARHDGGKGGNQAVAAARLGAATAFVGAVGDDAFGAEARAALAAEGVDVSELATLPGEATGVALIVVAAGGENLIAVASGANLALRPGAVSDAIRRLSPAGGDVVLVGHEIPTAAARTALALARAAGSTTVLNPAPAAGIDRSVFGLADVVTPNRGELGVLVGAEAARLGRRGTGGAGDTVQAARSLVERNAEGPGAGAVLVSLGESGAILVRSGGHVAEIPAPRVDAVDTTGAGDALNGALAAALAAGMDLEAAARRAVVAASRSTTRPGARGGLVSAGELEEAPR